MMDAGGRHGPRMRADAWHLQDPEQIRVGPIGGARGARPGDGHGRAEWEQRYYGAELLKLSST
jgi:hypothetical protein